MTESLTHYCHIELISLTGVIIVELKLSYLIIGSYYLIFICFHWTIDIIYNWFPCLLITKIIWLSIAINQIKNICIKFKSVCLGQ